MPANAFLNVKKFSVDEKRNILRTFLTIAKIMYRKKVLQKFKLRINSHSEIVGFDSQSFKL